jgi:hypothetical protein
VDILASVQLVAVPGEFQIHRLAPDQSLPSAAWQSSLVAVLRSNDELSLVCDAQIKIDAAASVGPWRALRVQGTLDFALTGIIAGLTAPLAQAAISVFVIASFDTDYLLLRSESYDVAVATLKQAGYALAR